MVVVVAVLIIVVTPAILMVVVVAVPVVVVICVTSELTVINNSRASKWQADFDHMHMQAPAGVHVNAARVIHANVSPPSAAMAKHCHTKLYSCRSHKSISRVLFGHGSSSKAEVNTR